MFLERNMDAKWEPVGAVSAWSSRSSWRSRTACDLQIESNSFLLVQEDPTEGCAGSSLVWSAKESRRDVGGSRRSSSSSLPISARECAVGAFVRLWGWREQCPGVVQWTVCLCVVQTRSNIVQSLEHTGDTVSRHDLVHYTNVGTRWAVAWARQLTLSRVASNYDHSQLL